MYNIRLANINDVAHILEIAENSITPSWTHRSVSAALNRDDSLFFVAERREEDRGTVHLSESLACNATDTGTVLSSTRAVGFAAFRHVGGDGEILQIAVDENLRRNGVGSLLMAAVLDYAAKNSFESVFLEVRPSNEAAIRLYKKHGFLQLRTRKDYYNEPVEDAVVMTKMIGKSPDI